MKAINSNNNEPCIIDSVSGCILSFDEMNTIIVNLHNSISNGNKDLPIHKKTEDVYNKLHLIIEKCYNK